MNLSALDLNLLPLLDALLAERHLTRAARRVGLSQPAASHALARLRTMLDDPLFVRTRGGLVPTARAEALRDPLRDALARLSRTLAPEAPLDPATLRRTFRIGASDFAELLVVGPLIAHLQTAAPSVDIWVLGRSADDLGDLARGDVDLAVRPVSPRDRQPGIRHEPLFEERFACVVRVGHPLLDAPLTPERFAAARHAFIAPGGRPGGVVDDALTALGLTRRVALAVPHFLVAPRVVAETDLVLTVPGRIARRVAAELPLQVFDPPLALQPFSMSMLWHERAADDAGLRWLRRTLRERTPD